jgi:hypothetical protein
MKEPMLTEAPVTDVRAARTPTPEERHLRTGSMAVCLAFSAMLLAPPLAGSIPSPPPDPLAPVRDLIGRWQGTTEGQPGKGDVEPEYTPLLGTRFVHVRNQSRYRPQDKNPKGETHQDLGVFSFDKSRQRIVFRQFHGEGFVNQYVTEAATKPGILVFTSEAIENIAAGWRARETYRMLGPDEIEEVFELAEPGKDFETYSHTRLRRVP